MPENNKPKIEEVLDEKLDQVVEYLLRVLPQLPVHIATNRFLLAATTGISFAVLIAALKILSFGKDGDFTTNQAIQALKNVTGQDQYIAPKETVNNSQLGFAGNLFDNKMSIDKFESSFITLILQMQEELTEFSKTNNPLTFKAINFNLELDGFSSIIFIGPNNNGRLIIRGDYDATFELNELDDLFSRYRQRHQSNEVTIKSINLTTQRFATFTSPYIHSDDLKRTLQIIFPYRSFARIISVDANVFPAQNLGPTFDSQQNIIQINIDHFDTSMGRIVSLSIFKARGGFIVETDFITLNDPMYATLDSVWNNIINELNLNGINTVYYGESNLFYNGTISTTQDLINYISTDKLLVGEGIRIEYQHKGMIDVYNTVDGIKFFGKSPAARSDSYTTILELLEDVKNNNDTLLSLERLSFASQYYEELPNQDKKNNLISSLIKIVNFQKIPNPQKVSNIVLDVKQISVFDGKQKVIQFTLSVNGYNPTNNTIEELDTYPTRIIIEKTTIKIQFGPYYFEILPNSPLGESLIQELTSQGLLKK